MAAEHEATARLLSRLAAAGFRVQPHHDAALRTAVQRCLDAIARETVLAGLFAQIALAEEIERLLGIGKDRVSEQRIQDVVNAWLAERKNPGSATPERPQPKPPPQRPQQDHSAAACDAHAFGQIERAAHVLQMLTAGGVRVARPSELNRLLGMMASSISRLGPNVRSSDYDTADATLAALEAANLIIIDTAKRKRAIAILGSALVRH